MTMLANGEIERYVGQVAAALADLRAEARADLLEDLPGHLAEVLTEGEGVTLHDRLGDPSAYAAELRSAAGFAPVATTGRAAPRLAEVSAQLRERLERADAALGALLGYGRAVELLRALRPGWWVLRGWIVALMIRGAFLHAHWTGFVPRVDGDWPLGVLLLAACVVASAAIGHRTSRGSAQTRLTAALVSVTIAVFGICIARNVVGWDYQHYAGPGSEYVQPAPPTAPVQPPPP